LSPSSTALKKEEADSSETLAPTCMTIHPSIQIPNILTLPFFNQKPACFQTTEKLEGIFMYSCFKSYAQGINSADKNPTIMRLMMVFHGRKIF
jgi:hypothetical protein